MWRKSSKCESSHCVEVNFVTSEQCETNNCVQVGLPVGECNLIHLRDSKNPDIVLNFTRDEWDAFLAGAKDGEFDL